MQYRVTVDFEVDASDEQTAVALVQFELAARQEYAIDSVLGDYVVREVN